MKSASHPEGQDAQFSVRYPRHPIGNPEPPQRAGGFQEPTPELKILLKKEQSSAVDQG